MPATAYVELLFHESNFLLRYIVLSIDEASAGFRVGKNDGSLNGCWCCRKLTDTHLQPVWL